MTNEEAMAKIEEAQDLLERFQEIMKNHIRPYVKQISERTYNRVDAYPGWDFDRDAGMGIPLSGWVEDVATAIENNCCARCGEAFEIGEEKSEVARTARDVYDHEDDEDGYRESALIHQACMAPDEAMA